MVYIIYGHAKHLDDDKYWDTIGYETDLESAEYDKMKLEEANGDTSEFDIRSYDIDIDTDKLDLPYTCCSLFMAIKYDPICVFNRPLWEKNNWKKNIWCDNF